MQRQLGIKPSPNTFVVSANQIADNVAEQAHMLGVRHGVNEHGYNLCTYPPFSPRWSFSFDGHLTNK